MEKSTKRLIRAAERLLQAAKNIATVREAKNVLEDVQICGEGYAEPGYSGEVVALANWNTISRYDKATQTHIDVDDTPKRLSEALERAGIEIEWSDEWSSCGACGKLVRTSPDSYGWTPSYHDVDGERSCIDCLAEDSEAYLESLEGDPNTANTMARRIDPSEHEYVRLDENFEHGFHPGQDADPKRIAKTLEEQGISRFLFQIDSQGQFDTRFSCWIHASEAPKLNAEAVVANADGPSVSGAMERGLREASAQFGALQGEGVRYAEIKPDGSVATRLISSEDFVTKGTKP